MRWGMLVPRRVRAGVDEPYNFGYLGGTMDWSKEKRFKAWLKFPKGTLTGPDGLPKSFGSGQELFGPPHEAPVCEPCKRGTERLPGEDGEFGIHGCDGCGATFWP